MKLTFLFCLTSQAQDYGFGRPPRGRRNRFAEDEIRIASNVLERQVPYKTIKKYMDFEGYQDDDWRIDFEGIVRSFLTDESSSKGPEMVGKLTRSSSLTPEDREYMQRYLQLKYAILFMQRRKTFGKYCFYGCWCMPKGALDIGVGQGHPVDAIDQSCHDFATCYNCLYSKEIGRECDESDTGNYRMTGRNNPVTGEKTLSCSKITFLFFYGFTNIS